MTIALIHHHKAFLPALEGYQQFFSNYGIHCAIVDRNTYRQQSRDIDWFFMGTDVFPRKKAVYTIHEYISPSTPPLGAIKDAGKRLLNSRPHLRIFKNEYVHGHFPFKDQVPFCYQDIGIPSAWLTPPPVHEKIYDFIYIGDLSPRRDPEPLLQAFTRPALRSRTLLLLSSHYEHWQQQFKDYPNILFRGPVPRQEVQQYIHQSAYGINYIPDREPFNRLTSTKFLEYAACRLPVISTRYQWIEAFEQSYGGRYFYLSRDLSNLSWENLQAFSFESPDLHCWTWEQQLRRSGVLEVLRKEFPALLF